METDLLLSSVGLKPLSFWKQMAQSRPLALALQESHRQSEEIFETP
jgi:hypothetical protein